ncbi:MAG: hypothetical protein Q8P11_02930 [bacterium]|nr:hypothetical protein [bacterium]
MNRHISSDIFDIVSTTKDKIVVVEEDEAFVVMPLSQYRMLLRDRLSSEDLTEGEIVDSINRDIALWRLAQEQGDIDSTMGYDSIETI